MHESWRSLMIAKSKYEVLEALQENPDISTARDAKGWSIYHYLASSSSHKDLFISLLTVDSSNVTTVDNLGHTCLELCVDPDVAAKLVSFFTPLQIQRGVLAAIARDRCEVMETLLSESEYVQDDLNRSWSGGSGSDEGASSPGSVKSSSTSRHHHHSQGYRFIRSAIKNRALKCIPVLINRYGPDLCDKSMWQECNAVEVVDVLVNNKVMISQVVFEQLSNPDIIVALLESLSTDLAVSQPILETLIESGKSTEHLTGYKLPPSTRNCISMAASRDDVGLLQLLLCNRYDPPTIRASDEEEFLESWTDEVDLEQVALEAASTHGAVNCVSWLLTWLGDTKPDVLTSVPLVFLACGYCQLDIVKLLIERGIQPDLTDEETGQNALHALAVVTGDAIGQTRAPPDYITLLDYLLPIMKGHINEQDTARGDSPLHLAVRESNWIAVERFIMFGAELNIVNNDHLTPINIAEKQESSDKLQLVIKTVLTSQKM